MLETILIVLAAIVVVFVAIVAMQPSDFRIVRSGAISAPAADVFAHVNDFHNWAAWSPWGKLDPALKRTHEGALAGTGAIYSWIGDRKSTRLNSSHVSISYAVFCLKKKNRRL